ncbi:hypothetical protein XENORESO_001293 [Xenotaenia resolanae]|uniref:Uncharacterized protein n=1 Tax=Xenotaenia resolanae TaxID=208358 RepID=A0ABV0X137_9TELE
MRSTWDSSPGDASDVGNRTQSPAEKQMVGRLILCYIVGGGLRAATPLSYQPRGPTGSVGRLSWIQNGRKRQEAWWRPATYKWSNIQQTSGPTVATVNINLF